MFFNYRIWHYLTRPCELATEVKTLSVKNNRSRFIFLLLFAMLLFGIQSALGIGTASHSQLLRTMTVEDYTIARWLSFAGSLVWALLYVSFHTIVIAYLFHWLTDVPFCHLLPMQIGISFMLLIEKTLLLIVFILKGITTNLSLFSFGPLVTLLTDQWWIIFFFNQLSLVTIFIICYQYLFFRTYGVDIKRPLLLTIVIALPLIQALLTTAIGFVPFESLYDQLVEGGE